MLNLRERWVEYRSRMIEMLVLTERWPKTAAGDFAQTGQSGDGVDAKGRKGDGKCLANAEKDTTRQGAVLGRNGRMEVAE